MSTFPTLRLRDFNPVAPPEPPARHAPPREPHGSIFGVPQIFRPDPRTEEVQGLLENLRSGGDRDEIFRRLVDLYSPDLRGLFARKGWNPDDCDELIQETFMRVATNLTSLRNDRAFAGWLISIAKNVERAERKKRTRILLSESALEIPGNDPSPYRRTEIQERLRWVSCRILSLPPKRRTIFLFKYFQGRENSEIADLLGCTESTVRVQLYLARKDLGGGGL